VNNIKKHPYLFVTSIILMLAGIALIFVDTSSIMQVIMVIFGVLCIFNGLFSMMAGRTLIAYLYGLLYMALGIILFFNQPGVMTVVTIIFAVFAVILPIVRIILENDKLRQLKMELPALIIAIVIIFLGIPTVFKYVLVGLLIGAGIFLLVSILNEKPKLTKAQKRNAIDI